MQKGFEGGKTAEDAGDLRPDGGSPRFSDEKNERRRITGSFNSKKNELQIAAHTAISCAGGSGYLPSVYQGLTAVSREVTRAGDSKVGLRAYTRARIRVRENVTRFRPSKKWPHAYTRADSRIRAACAYARIRAPARIRASRIFSLF